MEARELIRLIATIDNRNGLYLLAPINVASGFFSNDGTLLFVVQDRSGYKTEWIETDFLQLQTHVRINAVLNHQTFSDGFYNLISYKAELENPNFDSFVKLCEVYARNEEKLSFKEFFYSLIDLFQLPSEQGYKNAVGLFGELKFMQYIQNQFSEDISIAWHRSGSYSKFDFSGHNACLEIKTTVSTDGSISIKHKQVFQEHPCFIGVVCCDLFDGGETIAELINALEGVKNCFNNLNFCINLAKELKRLSPRDIAELRFSATSIRVFRAANINPFTILPENVFSLTYRLDVEECEEENSNEIQQMVIDLLT